MYDFQEHKLNYGASRLDSIRGLPAIQALPDPQLSLTYSRSLRHRRQLRQPVDISPMEISKFKQWLMSDTSSVLLAEAKGIKTSSKDFLVDFLNQTIEQQAPTIWAIPHSLGDEQRLSITEILCSLVVQSLQLDSSALTAGRNPVTINHFQSDMSIEQCLQMLERCWQAISRLYVVIDLALVEKALENDSFRPINFVHGMQNIVERHSGGVLKILIASWRFEAVTMLPPAEVFGDSTIATDKGSRAARLARNPKHRAILTARSRNRASGFGIA